MYASFKRKFEYLLAYAGADLAEGLHHLSYAHFYSPSEQDLFLLLLLLSDRPSFLTERYASALQLILQLQALKI
jgi:hypothetical protein